MNRFSFGLKIAWNLEEPIARSSWGLRPGIALAVEQMAQLTSDIVWLVEQTITLADGPTTTALVPQVYLRVQPCDLARVARPSKGGISVTTYYPQ